LVYVYLRNDLEDKYITVYNISMSFVVNVHWHEECDVMAV